MDPLASWEAAAALAALIFVAALLYSSVGHAGASGYLAAMALFGLPPAVMKPTALVLNVLVATIGTWKFVRAGCFSWRLFWPFAVASVPLAFVGGSLALSVTAYKRILGVVLLFAAWRLTQSDNKTEGAAATGPPPVALALPIGAALGFLAGLTGVGGGIFLTPLLLLLRWSETRMAAGVSAVFILVNSAAGLAGHVASLSQVPAQIAAWAPAALLGGWIGAGLGSRRLPTTVMRRVLAVVLFIAAVKMLAT